VVAERVTRAGVFQAHDGGNVTGVDGVHILTSVGVHSHDTPDALFLVAGGVQHRLTGGKRTRVDAEERQNAVLVGRDLEGQRAERLLIGGLAAVFLAGVRVGAGNGIHV